MAHVRLCHCLLACAVLLTCVACPAPAADDPASATDDQRDAAGVVLQRADYGTRRGSVAWHSESADRDLEGQFSKEILTYYDQNTVPPGGENGSFAGIGGYSIAYDVLRAPNEKGAVVFSHGTGESSASYAELAYDLHRQGYSVFLINHRGQGFSQRLLSDPQRTWVSSFQDYVEDFDTFVRTVVKPAEHENLFALGHSMGGGIVTLHAEQYPSVFKAIALSSPMHAIRYPFIGARTLIELEAPGKSMEYALGEGPFDPNEKFPGNPGVTTSPSRFAIADFIVSKHPEIALGGVTWGWLREASNATDRMLADAARLTAPLLVLSSDDDELIDVSGQLKVCGRMNNARRAAKAPDNCTAISFPRSKHELLNERDEVRNAALDEVALFFQAHTR